MIQDKHQMIEAHQDKEGENMENLMKTETFS